jgi:hypothetical protein
VLRTAIEVVDLGGKEQALYSFAKSETGLMVCNSSSGVFTFLLGDKAYSGERQ